MIRQLRGASGGSTSRLISAQLPDILRENQNLKLSWSDLPASQLDLGGQPLSLDQTLGCGQAFRWARIGPECWEGVAGGLVWRLGLDGDSLTVQSAPPSSPVGARAFLARYLRLDLDVRAAQAEMSSAHPAAAESIRQFGGLRILRQEPVETLLTFTMATATNVPRVTRNVREVSDRFGTVIALVDGVVHRDFPTVDQILRAPVEDLYGPCNLAYRARSIHAVARALDERGTGWAAGLAGGPYADAHEELDALPFFGPKVSDCVCLFGCGFDQAVPVDIHVWAIAHELYEDQIPTRTLTTNTYTRIGALFRSTFGPWAGWPSNTFSRHV